MPCHEQTQRILILKTGGGFFHDDVVSQPINTMPVSKFYCLIQNEKENRVFQDIVKKICQRVKATRTFISLCCNSLFHGCDKSPCCTQFCGWIGPGRTHNEDANGSRLFLQTKQR